MDRDSPSAYSASAFQAAPATSHQRRYILPEISAFVVFEIDPVASLSEGAQGVPEAIEACKRLANKPYVGVVVRRNGMYLPWEPYNTCLVRFIQQGDPKSVPTKFIEPRMSVPVLPVTTDSHISGRAPIRPSKLLPWNDCHISVSADAFVRSPSTFTDNPADWKLDDEEEDRLQDMMLDDIDEAEAKRYASELEARRQDIQTSSSVTGVADGVVLSVGSPSEYQLSKVVKQDLDNNNHIKDTSLDRTDTQVVITVHFKHDLSSVEQLNDPLEYFEEVEAIQRILKELAPPSRIAECRALKLQDDIRRAKEMDATLYDNQTMDMLDQHDELAGQSPSLGRSAAKEGTDGDQSVPGSRKELDSNSGLATIFFDADHS
ncbi:hypothetical protein R3P38DRAFT_2980934 [Favolaschia claudopus]|uniref:Uncharacterized protein n=1 Tax=Favolaschia claudopus TaxID=2862362 RepID=A0AAW0B1M5_9AGAR